MSLSIPEFQDKALALLGLMKIKLDAVPDSGAELTALRAEKDQLAKDLGTAKQSIGTLTAELETLKTANATLGQANTQLTSDLAAAQATIANPEGEIAKQAALRANEIATKMGVPPVVEETQKDGKGGGAKAYEDMNWTERALVAKTKNPTK